MDGMLVVSLLILLCCSVAYLAHWIMAPLVASRNQPAPSEYHHQFSDPTQPHGSATTWQAFPSVFDEPTLFLSLIVPCYNEQERLPDMMDETMRYLEARAAQEHKFTYEVIIVDDGSTDSTSATALHYVKEYSADKVRLLRLRTNQGKGGAVQQGMLHARGLYLLMVDGDGATRISDLKTLEEKLVFGGVEHGIAIGSRAHIKKAAVAQRKWYRNILMYGFHFLVAILCGTKVQDTQCGFKLFSRKAAQWVFTNQHLRRWSFDVELLFIAQKLDFPIHELPVHWTEIPGSKVNLVQTSLMMARDLLIIRFAYMTSMWVIQDPMTGNRVADVRKSKK